MTKLDPIIAVKDVNASATWYKDIFGFKRIHGGNEFAVLTTDKDEIILCLHKWGEHNHPSMMNTEIPAGNGFILYFKTKDLATIRKNVEKNGSVILEDIHLNPNSRRKEFSLRDPDGYFLTITEYHEYEG